MAYKRHRLALLHLDYRKWRKKTLSASFNTAYDWANMLDEYTSTSTTAQNDAVAKLMYNCGVSVDMGYGTGASGAQSSKIPRSSVNLFRL